MLWIDVLQRIAAGEDEKTDFKRSPADLSKVGRAICAFANTDGGVLVLGVDDTGRIVGVPGDPDQVQERLTSFLQSGLGSPVAARLGRQADPVGWVPWIEVPRQRGVEPQRFQGRVWVRCGRASAEPSPAELQDLYNAFGYILTEERYIEAAGVADIDADAFYRFLRKVGIDLDELPQPALADDLRNRRVLTEATGRPCATLYGLLAFGRRPQAFHQTGNFWVECVGYVVQDRASDTFLVGEARGRLEEQVERAVGWVRGLGRFERYEGLVRRDIPLVPERVLREAVVNAVVHRDYAITGSKVLLEVFADRVVVTSPGALPNQMTEEIVKAGGSPRSRNELMANYLSTLGGYMEQRGRGWPVMRSLMRRVNGTEPLLENVKEGRFVRVTLLLTPQPGDAP
ncbi:MAG: RNA-binding domain-containing protein [Candidatus Latescibacterota bacterium]